MYRMIIHVFISIRLSYNGIEEALICTVDFISYSAQVYFIEL